MKNFFSCLADVGKYNRIHVNETFEVLKTLVSRIHVTGISITRGPAVVSISIGRLLPFVRNPNLTPPSKLKIPYPLHKCMIVNSARLRMNFNFLCKSWSLDLPRKHLSTENWFNLMFSQQNSPPLHKTRKVITTKNKRRRHIVGLQLITWEKEDRCVVFLIKSLNQFYFITICYYILHK